MSRLLALLSALVCSLAANALAQETPAQDVQALDFSEPLRSSSAPTRLSDAWSDERPAPAAETVVNNENRPSNFQLSLSAGFGTSFSSLHEDLVAINGDAYEDVPDAFGITGSLTLGGLAYHSQGATGSISILAGYRASVDAYVLGILDTGFIHRHEATVALGVNRRVVVGLGGGLSVYHGSGETLVGGAVHLEARVGLGGGMFLGIPMNISMWGGDETIVLVTTAVEIGWQSL